MAAVHLILLLAGSNDSGHITAGAIHGTGSTLGRLLCLFQNHHSMVPFVVSVGLEKIVLFQLTDLNRVSALWVKATERVVSDILLSIGDIQPPETSKTSGVVPPTILFGQ